MNILLSAYACNPNKGSESSVGWNWAKNLSKYNTIYVITREYNRSDIEENLSDEDKNLKFIYFDLPKKYDWFFMRNSYTAYLYYICWQYSALKKLKKSNLLKDLDIVQHLTYNGYKNPGFLYKLKKDFIIGPVGGGQAVPKSFYNYCGKHVISEKVRKVINNIMVKTPYLKKAYGSAKIVLIANEETENVVRKIDKNIKIKRMLETGISQEKINVTKKNNKKINIMWAGNSRYIKGLSLFLKSLVNLKNIDKVEVNLVGNIDISEYESLLEKNSLNTKINVTGIIPYNEMDQYYEKCDIFIFSSLRDTSGNVVLEAMSKGVPIVTLNHQGVKDIVTEECGIKIEPVNSQYVISNMSKAIDYLIENEQVRVRLGKNAAERIKEKYLWEKKAIELTTIYQKLKKGDN